MRRRVRLLLGIMLAAWTLTGHAAETDRAALMRLHRGGVLRLTANAGAGTIDPQINYESEFWQIFFFTQDELLTFRKAEGKAGLELVPDLADSIPQAQDNGTTYVFHLRQGIRFSTGAPVTVADVVASFQRMFKVSGPNTGSWYSKLVGADACLKDTAHCTLDGGVVADAQANTVTFHLTHADPEFLSQIAVPFAAILPAGTSPHDLGTTPPAATGPYMIASYAPEREMRLLRNPYFKEWSADAQPDGYVDEIRYRYGLQDESELTEVENNDQDWMYDEKPLDRLAEIGSRHTDLAHIDALLAYYYLMMNVNLPPFNEVKARQAVAFAVNRKALVNLYGGPALGDPLCQMLPKGLPAYVPYCPYTKSPDGTWSAPDLERARQLVRESGTLGAKVTLVTSDKQVERTMGIYLQSVLSDLGYQASVHSVSFNIRDTYLQNSSNHVQIGLTDWYQDYPAPSDFLGVLFSCKSFHPGSDASINMAGFCNQSVEADMDRAYALDVTDHEGALKLWTQIDREVTDLAPAATLFQIHFLDVVSPRLGNFRFHPLYHMMFAEAWVH